MPDTGLWARPQVGESSKATCALLPSALPLRRERLPAPRTGGWRWLWARGWQDYSQEALGPKHPHPGLRAACDRTSACRPPTSVHRGPAMQQPFGPWPWTMNVNIPQGPGQNGGQTLRDAATQPSPAPSSASEARVSQEYKWPGQWAHPPTGCSLSLSLGPTGHGTRKVALGTAHPTQKRDTIPHL